MDSRVSHGLLTLVHSSHPRRCDHALWRSGKAAGSGQYSDVTRAIWRLESPSTQLFIEQLVRARNNESIKPPHYWPFVRVIPCYSNHKGPVMQRAVPCYNITTRLWTIHSEPPMSKPFKQHFINTQHLYHNVVIKVSSVNKLINIVQCVDKGAHLECRGTFMCRRICKKYVKRYTSEKKHRPCYNLWYMRPNFRLRINMSTLVVTGFVCSDQRMLTLVISF